MKKHEFFGLIFSNNRLRIVVICKQLKQLRRRYSELMAVDGVTDLTNPCRAVN